MIFSSPREKTMKVFEKQKEKNNKEMEKLRDGIAGLYGKIKGSTNSRKIEGWQGTIDHMESQCYDLSSANHQLDAEISHLESMTDEDYDAMCGK